MADTAGADGDSPTDDLSDDDGLTEESLEEESSQGPASGESTATTLCFADDIVVGPPDDSVYGEEAENKRMINKGRRKATNVHSEINFDAAPVSR